MYDDKLLQKFIIEEEYGSSLNDNKCLIVPTEF